MGVLSWYMGTLKEAGAGDRPYIFMIYARLFYGNDTDTYWDLIVPSTKIVAEASENLPTLWSIRRIRKSDISKHSRNIVGNRSFQNVSDILNFISKLETYWEESRIAYLKGGY